MKRRQIVHGVYTLLDDDVASHFQDKALSLYGPKRCQYVRFYSNGRQVLLHRFIVDAPKGKQVDHINGDTLDNRRSNLRICSHQENMRNRKLSKRNTSGSTGVRMRGTRWEVSLRIDGKNRSLGTFDSKEEAVAKRQSAERKIFGEFSRRS